MLIFEDLVMVRKSYNQALNKFIVMAGQPTPFPLQK